MKDAVVKGVNLDSAADESATQGDSRRVNQVDTFAVEPRVGLVFHNEYDVRWNHRVTCE